MKVGVIGAGFMGGVHINAYTNMEEVELVGVADTRPDLAAAGAEAGGTEPFASYEELVESTEAELIDVCLPTGLHREIALKAARDGKHAIVEKPIARTLEDAEAMLDAFSGSPGEVFVGHVCRFFPEYVRIKEMYDSGRLGTVGVVRTGRRSPLLESWNDWYADWRMSGGPIVDLIIHDFDFLRWTFGEVERVYAKSTTGREYNRLDYVLATLRFRSGVIAHVEGHWGYPAPFCYSIEVAGDRALVSLDSAKQSPLEVLVNRESPGPPVRGSSSVYQQKSPYQLELEHFVRCAKIGEKPLVSARDAREALRISLAATESAMTGRQVELS